MLNHDIQPPYGNDVPGTIIYDDMISSNPFPGLRPFSIDECHLFFGREGQVDEVLLKISQNHFVAVMGYSGSGKSSLMHCGLVPILYGGFMTSEGPNWNVVTARPGFSPIDNLATSILASDPESEGLTEEEFLVNKTAIAAILRSSKQGLCEVLEKRCEQKGVNFLLLIDQFEELFRFEANDRYYQEARHYVSILLEACSQATLPIYLALTMRSDYIGECAKYPGLTQLINKSNYLVPQMDRDQQRMAIEGPVAVGGGRISTTLVKKLLNELGDNHDQLPILQHALMRTWNYWVENREPDEPIDVRHYNAVGRTAEALSQHANEAFDELGKREQEVAEVMFKALTEKTNDGFGRRRPAPIGIIAELANASVEEVINVADKFRKPGRSFLMPSSHVKLNAESVIEISHESLMRIWNKLRTWVEDEYESAQMYRRLSEAAAMYQIGRTGLWRPPDLQLALSWQKKQNPTRAWAQRYDEAFERAIVFLDTSRITYEAEQRNQEMLQKRLLKRTKIAAIILGVLAVIAIIFFVYATTQRIEATKQAAEALKQEENARTEAQNANIARQQAEAARDSAVYERTQAELARQQAETARDTAQYERLRALESERYAIVQQKLAEERQKEADTQRGRAEEATKEAKTNFSLANQRLYLSVAQSMAVKSVNLEESNLKGLLSQQAYKFNKRYEGREYDPYIYNGLYSALNQLKGKSFTTYGFKHRNEVRSLAIAKDNFYTTGTAGKLAVASLQNNTADIILSNRHPNRVVKLSPDEQWLIVGSDSAQVQVLNATNRKLYSIEGHTSFVNDLAFLNNTKFLSVSGDKTIRLNDISTLESQLFMEMPFDMKSMAISRSRQTIAIGGFDGSVVTIDRQSKSQKTILKKANVPIHALKFSPDGKFLAIGDEQGNVGIWNIGNNSFEAEFPAHKGRVNALAFSPDGKLLASGSFDKTIKMWVLDKLGELPIEMTDNDSYVWDINFSRNGEYLFAACGDGEVRVWPTRLETMADQVCDLLEKNMTHEQWETYVGNNIPYENTCLELLLNDY